MSCNFISINTFILRCTFIIFFDLGQYFVKSAGKKWGPSFFIEWFPEWNIQITLLVARKNPGFALNPG